MFMNEKQKELSSGNSLIDALIGGGTGFGEAYNKPGFYYVKSNWKGNGLADTGIGYLQNLDRRDYTSAGNAISSLLGKDKDNNFALSKLGGLFSRNKQQSPYTLQGELKNPPYSGYGQYNLPYQNYQLPQTTFNYNVDGGNIDNRLFGGYQLPVQNYYKPSFIRG